MELKTSTVKSVQANGKWKEFFKWEIEMANGDVGENLTQTEDQIYFEIHKEVKYEYDLSNPKFPKIKRPKKEQKQHYGGGKKQASVELDCASYSMSYTKDLVIGGMIPLDNMFTIATDMYNWMIGKVQKEEPEKVTRIEVEKPPPQTESDLPF